MLQMILIMSGLGTALIGIIVIIFEWRALVGHWRLKRRPPANLTMDVNKAEVGASYLRDSRSSPNGISLT